MKLTIKNCLAFIIIFLGLLTQSARAAAPDDITSGQRFWVDALDTQNQGYSSTSAVPTYVGNITSLTSWKSKINGYNAVSGVISGTTAPPTVASNAGVGANYTAGGSTALSVAGDIWGSGVTSVGISDNFIITSTKANYTSTFLFSSQAISGGNRISSHFPWNDGNIYYDPFCCLAGRSVSFSSPPAPATGLSANTLYITNWFSSTATNTKSVVVNATNYVFNNLTSVGTYTLSASSAYSLGHGDGVTYNGIISENIVYNRVLGTAERRILNNYFSAKWGMAIGTDDRYAGDTAANGRYRYHVGGIGQETDTVSTGTSEGLSISNGSFLAAGRYLIAGLPGLSAAGTMTTYDASTSTTLTAPQQLSGSVTTDIVSGLDWRAKRVWYLDKTDASNSTGTVNLSFDLSGKMGIASGLSTGDKLVLLYRSASTGNFQTIGTSVNYTSGTSPSFSVAANLLSDGYYTVGHIYSAAKPSLAKTSAVYSDPINNTTNPKNIPGAYVNYTLTLENHGDKAMTGSGTAPIVISDVIPSNLNLYVGSSPASTSPITVNCVNNGSPSTLTLGASDAYYFSDNAGTTSLSSSSLGPDANGFTSLVKSISLKPQGTLAAASAIDTPPYPSCAFTFKVKVN